MRTRTNLLIDAAALSVYLLAANPSATGLPVHEWIGLGFAVVGVVHLVLHRDWVVRTTSRFLARIANMSRVNLVADALTAIAAGTVTVSGFAISRTLSGLLGYTASTASAWHLTHTASAASLVLLACLHLALHWRWIVRAVTLHVAGPLFARLDGAPRPAPMARLVAWTVPTLLLAAIMGLAAGGATGRTQDAFASTATATTASTSSSSNGTLTCPRTGCTASTCHATSSGAAGGGQAGGPGGF